MPYIPPRVITGIVLVAVIFTAGWTARQTTLTTFEELAETRAAYERDLATANAARELAVNRADERAAEAEEHADLAGEHYAVAERQRGRADEATRQVVMLRSALAEKLPPEVIEKTPPAVLDRLSLLEGALAGSEGRAMALEAVTEAQSAESRELKAALDAMRESREWQVQATLAAEQGREVAVARVLEYEKAVQSRIKLVVGATGGRSFWPEGEWWAGVGLTLGWVVR